MLFVTIFRRGKLALEVVLDGYIHRVDIIDRCMYSEYPFVGR